MKKTLKKNFNIVWHVLVAVAFCGFIVLPFLHNAIDKTLGQWLWYPCLAIFLVYSFIPNKKMKEQSKFVQISYSGGILQLLFIISGIFVINYYDTGYNWYWFAFTLIAVSIPIGCVTVKAWAESKNTYSTEQVKAANVRLGKYIMFYWLLDLFYMACFNQWLVLQFVFGGVAMLIVFYSLTVAFLSEIKTNKWLLLTDFLLGIGLTVYLIYIIPNSSLQEILIPIISAVYGGLLTLVGVAWTIKSNNKDRKADLERIENERKEEERKQFIPFLRLDLPENAVGAVNTHFGQGLDFDKKQDLEKLSNNKFYCYKINDFSVKNLSRECIIIESIVVDGEERIFYGDKLVESGKSTWVKTTENWLVNSANILKSIKLKCKDLIGNSYFLNCKFEYDYPHGFYQVETEIEGITYKGWNIEYSVSRIDLPELLQEQ